MFVAPWRQLGKARKQFNMSSIARTDRDARGRFAPGNQVSSQGGRARAAKLSPRRRKAIARKGYRTMVTRHFGGDQVAQRKYFGELGVYNYEVQAGTFRPGSPLRTPTRHPGPIQTWRARYYNLQLFVGAHLDADFFGEASRGQ